MIVSGEARTLITVHASLSQVPIFESSLVDNSKEDESAKMRESTGLIIHALDQFDASFSLSTDDQLPVHLPQEQALSVGHG